MIPQQWDSMCVCRCRKPCELSRAATRQAPAASRGRESQSDLFPSSLRGYFYQCGWARQVLDREGLPYSTGLQTDCVCTTDSSAFYMSVAVCVSLSGSRQPGEQWIARLTVVVLPIKSQNSNLWGSTDEEWKSLVPFVTLLHYWYTARNF